MKLSKVYIHNFRGILDQEINLKDFGLLIGPNNSGKSTVINAILAFYEKDGFKFDRNCDFPKGSTPDQESWVELTFTLLDDEYNSLADLYKQPSSKELRLRKYFMTETKTKDGKSAAGFIFGYTTDGSLNNEPFYGAKNVQSGKLGNLVYIPAISKVDEHAKLSGPSALRDLLNDIMSEVVQSGQAYKDFSKAIQTFSSSIRGEKTTDGRSLTDFESQLNDFLKPWEVEFNLEVQIPQAADIIKSLIKFNLTDRVHGCPQEINVYGSGFQRYFIYSLIRLAVQYKGTKSQKKAKDFTPELTLILFEEPEAYLHPPQQEELSRNLRELAASNKWQVICATHSAHFVSRNAAEIPAFIRLRRSNGQVKVFQIGESEWQSITNANQQINEIAKKYPKVAKDMQEEDTKPEMEAVKYFIWLNPDRAGAFFADHVLLVEGATEAALINKLIGDRKIKTVRSGLYVMDCIGKYNIHRFMNLFGRLGIAHSVLHDDDHNKAAHAEFSQLIQESMFPGLTIKIKQISGDLEKMLGLPPPGSPHRKPQHVLYLYESEQIDQTKLDAFCKLVEECLSSDGASSSMEGMESTQAS